MERPTREIKTGVNYNGMECSRKASYMTSIQNATIVQILADSALPVREITKSSSAFSATNINSNMIWFLQLHDTIEMKPKHTGIKYNHNNIAIRSHIMIYDSVSNLILPPNLVAIYLAKGQNRLVFQLSVVNLQRAKDGTHIFDAKYRYVFVLYISSNHTFGITPHQSLFQMNVCLTCNKKMLLNLVAKMKFFHIFLYH